MQPILKKAAILALLPLFGACAAVTNDDSGLDWSKATTYNVKTGHGDRVVMHVLGDEKSGYDYQAQIRHTTRSDPDPIDRQRVLQSASRTLVSKLCTYGGEQKSRQFAPNNYEQIGRFVCNPR